MSAALPRSLWLLVTKPGFLTAEWIAGRRARYLNPFQLYLIATLVLITAAVLFASQGQFEFSVSEVHRQLVLTAMRQQHRQSITVLVLVAVPVFATLVWLIVRRGYFVEHLVFSIHAHTFFFLIGAVTWALNDVEFIPPGMVQLGLLIGCALYLSRAMRRAFGHAASGLQIVLVSFGYMWFVVSGAELALDRFGQQTIRAREDALDDVRARASANASVDRFRYVMDAHYGNDTSFVRRTLTRTIAQHNNISPNLITSAVRFRRAKLYLLAGQTELAAIAIEQINRSDPNDLLLRVIDADLARARADTMVARRLYLAALRDFDSRVKTHAEEYAPYLPELERFRREAEAFTRPPGGKPVGSLR